MIITNRGLLLQVKEELGGLMATVEELKADLATLKTDLEAKLAEIKSKLETAVTPAQLDEVVTEVQSLDTTVKNFVA